jgi:hypothetical protein
LHVVRVLVFIDEDVEEPLLILFLDLGRLIEEADDAQEQVVKIQRVSLLQRPLVPAEDAGDDLLEPPGRLLRVGDVVDGVVFRAIDQREQQGRGERPSSPPTSASSG